MDDYMNYYNNYRYNII
ncbi:MAG: hypothetical protein ACI35S_07885 [Anaeroplasma sp.]